MPLTKIYKRDGTLVPFDKERISRAIYKAFAEVSQPDLKLAQDFADKVVDILKHQFPKITPTVENIQDIVEQVLIKQGHDRLAKTYILYRQKRKEIREEIEKGRIENIPYQSIWEILNWNIDHQCETVEKLNKYVKDKKLGKLVQVEEERYNQEILNISSLIRKQRNQIKLLIVTGPSSSGKTATTDRLGQELKKKKISFAKLNVDHYFYSLKVYLKDEFGDFDFEGPYALDIPLLNQHLKDLLTGKKVRIPQYDFKRGRRKKETKEFSLKSNQILLIDSHYGIYPRLTESVPDSQKYKVYLETLCQLKTKNGRFVRWTDIRLLRRMIRNSRVRNHDPAETVGHWHYVRQGELKNIIPYISTADYILNTTLAYELPILKHYLFHYFPQIIKTYQKDKKRQDAHFRAKRVNELLKEVKEWPNDKLVPQNSILREFIG